MSDCSVRPVSPMETPAIRFIRAKPFAHKGSFDGAGDAFLQVRKIQPAVFAARRITHPLLFFKTLLRGDQRRTCGNGCIRGISRPPFSSASRIIFPRVAVVTEKRFVFLQGARVFAVVVVQA